MSQYSQVFPTIRSSTCASGSNCAIGAVCTANSQCSSGGCCGYKFNFANLQNTTLMNQTISSYGLQLGTINGTLISSTSASYNALNNYFYLSGK